MGHRYESTEDLALSFLIDSARTLRSQQSALYALPNHRWKSNRVSKIQNALAAVSIQLTGLQNRGCIGSYHFGIRGPRDSPQ